MLWTLVCKTVTWLCRRDTQITVTQISLHFEWTLQCDPSKLLLRNSYMISTYGDERNPVWFNILHLNYSERHRYISHFYNIFYYLTICAQFCDILCSQNEFSYSFANDLSPSSCKVSSIVSQCFISVVYGDKATENSFW